MESADRIPFAASRGLRRQAFTWRERLKPRKRRKYLPRLLLLVWMTIFLGFVFGAPRAFEVLLATFSPLRVMGLVVCGLALVIVVRLIPRTQPFRGYLDRGGLVIETRGSETRFAWDDFVAREALPKVLSLQLKQGDVLPRLFALRVRTAAWFPLEKRLFSSDADWRRALDLAGSELARRAVGVSAASSPAPFPNAVVPAAHTITPAATDRIDRAVQQADTAAEPRIGFAGKLEMTDLLRSHGHSWWAKWRAWRARAPFVAIIGTLAYSLMLSAFVFVFASPERMAAVQVWAPFLLLVAIAVAFMLWSMWASARRAGRCEGYFTRRGLFFKSSDYEAFLDWPSFSGHLDSKRVVLLQLDRMRTMVIPRRWLASDQDWLQVLVFVQKNVPCHADSKWRTSNP